MYTQCPHCDAIFQVTTAQLKAANGEVRCGQCLTVFNALNHLSDEIPASINELELNALDDTESNDPWADEHSIDNNPAETAIENITADDTSFESKIIIEATTDTSAETADTDIFSEVIAEASHYSLPTAEMDRFEAFLSTDTPASDDVETEHSRERTEESAEESAEDFNDAAFDIGGLDVTKLGDTETATDGEFAEFEEYLSADDELENERTTRSTETTNSLEREQEYEVIIIEDADLAPITSLEYTDKPGGRTEDLPDVTMDSNTGKATVETINKNVESDDFSELEKAAAEVEAAKNPPPSSPKTFHIPALIMEDLHAAKAEQLRPSNTPWVIGNLVLMLALVLQVVYFSRDELAKDASLRPWLVQMCQITNCTLTQPYDIKQIDIIGREVRTHPSARKALIASTTLINNASFVQPFPLLTVVFSDINGKPMAQRRFTPREYLNNIVDLDAGMTPDMPVRIELELVDPGKAAVNYEFHAELDPRNTRPIT